MAEITLVTRRFEAGARFLRALGRTLPIRLAFWLKDADSRRWRLYIISEVVEQEGPKEGYRRVVEAAEALSDPDFRILDVKLIGPSSRLAREAISSLASRSPQLDSFGGDGELGGLEVLDLMVYPVNEATGLGVD